MNNNVVSDKPSIEITLGQEEDLKILYSYPNDSQFNESLAETVAYWLRQTVERDGFSKDDVSVEVVAGIDYTLKLFADEGLHTQLQKYQDILDRFYALGLKMYNNHIVKMMDDESWDPNKRGWRYMLPLGLPLMNKKAIQFFHFPTLRLLTNDRDSLNDPVPARVEDLTMANGAGENEIKQYMMMANSIPIAGPDDEGELVDILVEKYRTEFMEYDCELLDMLLSCSPDNGPTTIPIVVWGDSTRKMFDDIFGTSLNKPNETDIASILDGKKTAVLSQRHPFSFFYRVQKEPDSDNLDVTYPGTGKYELDDDSSGKKFKTAYEEHRSAMIGAAWLEEMVKDHSADPAEVYAAVSDYWQDPKRESEVLKWMLYHATMWVENSTTGKWAFLMGKDQLPSLGNFIEDVKNFERQA